MAVRPSARTGDDPFSEHGTLPEQLPDDPWPLFTTWWHLAHNGGDSGRPVQPNPSAMSLATVASDGTPSNRIVLCRDVNPAQGRLTFYTNYEGRKGRELSARPVAAACFHWDPLDRQIRVVGPVTRSPEAESDAYFASRALIKRLGAWASDQSRPVGSRDALLERYASVLERFGVPLDVLLSDGPAPDIAIPRPPHWGGFRLWAARVELWIGGRGRFHDRAEWSRDLSPTSDGYIGAPWRATRLQP
jgi:pyridoxamine 5'-phosphate oxidase